MTMREGRTIYILRLRPLPRVDPIRAPRSVLKTLLRRHRMRCISIHEMHNSQTEEENA
jgi:hypothetical protein